MRAECRDRRSGSQPMGCRGATAPLFGAFTSLRVPVNAPQATTTVLEGAWFALRQASEVMGSADSGGSSADARGGQAECRRKQPAKRRRVEHRPAARRITGVAERPGAARILTHEQHQTGRPPSLRAHAFKR